MGRRSTIEQRELVLNHFQNYRKIFKSLDSAEYNIAMCTREQSYIIKEETRQIKFPMQPTSATFVDISFLLKIYTPLMFEKGTGWNMLWAPICMYKENHCTINFDRTYSHVNNDVLVNVQFSQSYLTWFWWRSSDVTMTHLHNNWDNFSYFFGVRTHNSKSTSRKFNLLGYVFR